MKPRAKSFDSKGEAERWARDLEAQVDHCGSTPDTRVNETTALGAVMARYAQEVSPTKRGAKQEISISTFSAARNSCIARSRVSAARTLPPTATHVSSASRPRPSCVSLPSSATSSKSPGGSRGFPLSVNVVKQVRRPTIASARSRRLVNTEEQRLLDGCDAGRTPCFKSLVIVAIKAAMRRGELLSLRWCDVDLEQRVAHLAMTKNRAHGLQPAV